MSVNLKYISILVVFWLAGQQKISAAPPNWQVNPASYQYNMTGIFRVFKNNSGFMNEAGSKIGIFVGNEIRGVVNGNNIIFSGGNAYFPATMYSNTQQGEILTFKVYVPSLDSVFTAAETANFNRTQTLGTPQNPFILNITTCTGILILTTVNSPLSGTYRATQEIRLQGIIVVPSNGSVILDAPIIKSQGQFTPSSTSQVIVKTGGCL